MLMPQQLYNSSPESTQPILDEFRPLIFFSLILQLDRCIVIHRTSPTNQISRHTFVVERK